MTDVDTIGKIVPPSPLAWEALPSRRSRRRWLWWLSPLALLVVATIVASVVYVPYYELAPGQALGVNDLIDIPADRRHAPTGVVYLTTVTTHRVRALEAISGWLDPDVDVVPQEQILGRATRRQFRQVNLEAMDDSKQVAVVVALRRLGYHVAEQGDGVLIAAVGEEVPATDRLEPGETIVAVDGQPTKVQADAIRALSTKKFGEVVRLEVERASGQPHRTEEIRLGGRSADGTSCSAVEPGTGAGCIGVTLRTKGRRFDLPFPVAIDSEGIGGPSAGLAFAIGVIDALTPGELTGGRKVAVTGTIEIDGRIGEVGGVSQKTAVVRESGAEVFLVPPGEFEIASQRAGRTLRVVKVETLEDALQALGRLGGDVSALAGKPPVGAA